MKTNKGTPEDKNSKKDFNSIFDFLNQLQIDISDFIKPNKCNLIDLLNKKVNSSDESKSSYSNIFSKAYEETFLYYKPFLIRIEKQNRFSKKIYAKLKSVGMTGYSLELKLNLLEQLRKILTNLEDKTTKFLDFYKREIREAAKIFLQQLNSILGSISKAFPSLERIKEFKEQIEAANNLVGFYYNNV